MSFKRISAVAALVVAAFIAFTGVAANAQGDGPYASSIGDLAIESPGPVVPGGVVTFNGDGFAANTAVSVVLRDNATGTEVANLVTEAGPEGELSYELELEADMPTGTYTVSISGATPDGGVRELAGALTVGEPVAATTSTTESEPEADENEAAETEESADEGEADADGSEADADEQAADLDAGVPGDGNSSAAIAWFVAGAAVIGGFGFLLLRRRRG